MANDRGCGRNSSVPFASYDPDTRSWRTSQGCLFGGWIAFSATWPRSGTMRNGSAYRRRPLVPRTSAIGSSLWPTPRARADSAGDGTKVDPANHSIGRLPLHQVVRLYPTPVASDWKGPQGSRQRADLLSARVEMTPAWIPCDCCENFLCTIHGMHAHDCPCPPIEEWSTDPYRPARRGLLNPTWVEWLMGFPAGWTDCGPSATR
jgi:hypothetical protein